MIAGRKVISVTPCYAPAEMFDASRSRITWTPGLVDEFWVLLNKYPLPSVEANEEQLVEVAAKHGYRTFDSGADLGLHGSLNNFLAHNPQPPGTIAVGCDPDSIPDREGFDLALCEVLCADSNLPIVALGIPQTPTPNAVIAGNKVYASPSMLMFNIAATDLDFVSRAGGFRQPVTYWGGLEEMLGKQLESEGKHIGYLTDYRNDDTLRDTHDPRYATWKWEQWYGRFPGSFAEYLEAQ